MHVLASTGHVLPPQTCPRVPGRPGTPIGQFGCVRPVVKLYYRCTTKGPHRAGCRTFPATRSLVFIVFNFKATSDENTDSTPVARLYPTSPARSTPHPFRSPSGANTQRHSHPQHAGHHPHEPSWRHGHADKPREAAPTASRPGKRSPPARGSGTAADPWACSGRLGGSPALDRQREGARHPVRPLAEHWARRAEQPWAFVWSVLPANS